MSLKRARPFTTWEAIAERDALRFVALQPGWLPKSFSTSKENRDSNHHNVFLLFECTDMHIRHHILIIAYNADEVIEKS
jgi:hypothetical protein